MQIERLIQKMRLKLQVLKSLDAFPHAEEHLTQKTSSGAAVSIIGLAIMVTLFVHELRFYLTVVKVHEMSVDVKYGETLPIHVNISFPAIPCAILSVDAIDLSGRHEVDVDTNIWKLRLHKDGYILGSEYLSDLVEREHSHEHENVGDKHHEAGSGHTHLHTLGGNADKLVKDIRQALQDQEGCRVYGVLDVQRVAGNFHISIHGLSWIVAQRIFETLKQVNVSHIIHDLSFGPKYPGIHNPLDGIDRILHNESGSFKYYLKIVPTEYQFLSGHSMSTNQFSVMEYFRSLKDTDRTWPAVYFLYDLSPIIVTIKEQTRNFTHFITRVCAVLGGTFALTGMLDCWMHRLVEAATSSSKTRGILK